MPKSKHGKERAGGPGGGYYPTQWSAWELKEDKQREARYRLRAPEDYEIEWRPAPDIPRTPLPLEPEVNEERGLAEVESSSYGDNYITSNYTIDKAGSSFPIVDEITLGIARLSSDLVYIAPRTKRTQFEKFDKNYKVHNGHEFQWGRIFKILWTEPAGAGGQGSTHLTESVREGKHRELHYEKVRRFVIVSPRNGHCICLPINTYTGKGALKKGVHAEDHTIIYSTKEPTYFKGEEARGLTRIPIRVSPNNQQHKLDPASRLNYAKLYTVEFNVKVWFIGRIHKDWEHVITADYNDVHPPMTRGLNAPLSSDTFAHAQGGSGGSSQFPYGTNFVDSDFGSTSAHNYPPESSNQQTYYTGNNPEAIYEETAGAEGASVPPPNQTAGSQEQQLRDPGNTHE